MEFTIGELLEMQISITKISQIKDVPALVGYKIASLVRHLNGPVMDAVKAKEDLIRKYAGKPDEKNQISVLPENMASFFKELNELVAEKVEVDVKEVKLPADVKLPDASTLIGLDRFITV
jgi:hypothetical protein